MIKFWNAEVYVKIYSVKALNLSCSLSVILEVTSHFLTYMYSNKERSHALVTKTYWDTFNLDLKGVGDRVRLDRDKVWERETFNKRRLQDYGTSLHSSGILMQSNTAMKLYNNTWETNRRNEELFAQMNPQEQRASEHHSSASHDHLWKVVVIRRGVWGWQKANITLVFKYGKKGEQRNYWPVGITSTPGKVMEHLSLEALSVNMDDKKVIDQE